MIRHKADASTFDQNKKSILRHAIPRSTCKLEIVKTLLEHGAPSDSADTTLHHCITLSSFKRSGIAQLLFEKDYPEETIEAKWWIYASR